MAIKRQAESPGQNLMIDEPFRYSLKATVKKKRSDSTPKNAVALHPVSLRTDLIRTAIVFAVVLLILIGLYFKFG